ncbi:ankyrin-3-like isoform X2 [Atheta coriaria]
MPTEFISNPLQRELADSIIRMVPLDEIRILLACGSKVNEQVTQGLMPLHYAVWQRYYAAAQLLLTRGADVNAVDECGYSAMHLAAEHGFMELVRLLLQCGAKVDYRKTLDDDFPRTHLCDEPLRLAIRNKHMDVARLLLENGADPNKRYFFGSEINLINDLDFLQLLLTFGADPDSRDRSGLTPLMKASRQVHGLQNVLLLLKYGADVNAMADERHDYRTVLHYGVLSGSEEIVDLLIKQGSKLNYDDCDNIGKPSPLDLAILKGEPIIVAKLIKSGANVNYSSPLIGTPLHVASADNIPNRYEILKMLLEHGADPNKKVFNNDVTERNTQLRPVLVEYLASNENPSIEVVNILLQYGARVVIKTQFRDPDGLLNCLHNVISTAQRPIFDMLLESAECFDIFQIRRSNILTFDQKDRLLNLATTPLPLTHLVRLHLRRTLGKRMMTAVDQMELPRSLQEFLRFKQGMLMRRPSFSSEVE